ncbi:MAG: hypothetical protein OJF52_001508 [Nitrospira sp.]|jgi:hypothetical protein|nr:MAG: hypothetical protein OJF52_001508 [Nitrospira sp.]
MMNERMPQLDAALLKQPLKLEHLSDDDLFGRHHRDGSTDCRIMRQK